MQFTIHPSVYNTDPRTKGLLHMLEHVWVRGKKPGAGNFYIVSGFSNYNGGVRFYDVFKRHIDNGGHCLVILGGSTSQKLSSQQVVTQLLEVGCKVFLINRKRILHAKCYGYSYLDNQSLVISSGNFTGPGMSQNVEASLLIEDDYLREMHFSWDNLIDNILKQNWDIYEPSLSQPLHPAWRLLYDEFEREIRIEEDQTVTMLLTLSHSDTARIQANQGDTSGLGSQYFWLSKDSYDFFPALTIRNTRGEKATYSALIKMDYYDLNERDSECRVTFEAENNLDFRLGTGRLRYTKLADVEDIAAITRIGDCDYELRVIKKETDNYTRLIPYAINYIGHQGKKYGYISNSEFFNLIR